MDDLLCAQSKSDYETVDHYKYCMHERHLYKWHHVFS